MTHGKDIVERLSDKGAHLKRFLTAFSEEATLSADKPRFSAKKDRGSRKRRELKHQGHRNVHFGEREKLGGYFWVHRPVHGCGLGVVVRGGAW